MNYLLELRQRLLRCLIVTAALFGVLCFFANPLYQLLSRPLLSQLPSQHLIATNIAAPFLVPLKFTFIVSIFLLIPLFAYHIWSFVAPALYIKERKTVWVLLFPTVGLFYLGVLFAYFVVLPRVFHFFIVTTPAQVAVLPDMGHYLDFTLQLLFAFGLAFEVPIVVMVMVYFELYTIEQLRAMRRYVIVGAFVVAMFLTPPDILSQILLAIPLWLLYELGLVCASFMHKFSDQAKAAS